MYTFFLLLGVIMSAIFLSDNVEEGLKDKVCLYLGSLKSSIKHSKTH